MSAITDLQSKKMGDLNEIERCILYVFSPRKYDRTYIDENAAAIQLSALRARVEKLEGIARRLDGDIPNSTIEFYGWLAELRRDARAALEAK